MKNLHKFLSSLKLASSHKFTLIEVPYNKNWKHILQILYKEGHIQNYFIKNNSVIIYLRYYNKTNCIRSIHSFLNFSNLFIKKKNLWLFERQQGTLFLSTIEGIKTHTYCLQKNLGGKLLFFIT